MVLLAALYANKFINNLKQKQNEKFQTGIEDEKIMGLAYGLFIFVFILVFAILISFIVAIVKSIKLCGIESIIHIFIMFIFYPYVIIFLIAGESICNREDTYNNRRYNNRR
jgi:hypothetical protein